MFRKVCTIILSAALGMNANLVRAYSGGSGTPQDPYHIANPGDLIQLGSTLAGHGIHYVLTQDIDLSAHAFSQAVVGHPTWHTDNVIRDAFSGHFDGQGHVIRHMNIQGLACLGLFGSLAEGAVVANVRLEQAFIVSAGDQTGALVGLNLGLVQNCSVEAEVQGQDSIGGLVGVNRGTIVNCYSDSDVMGQAGIGGLAGTNEFGLVQCVYSLGTVNGSEHTGGLVGRNWGGTISNAYSAATVAGSFNTGGLVGDNPGAGEAAPEGFVINSFWDVQASGLTDSDAGIGLTTLSMQSLDTFLSAGWDFAGEWANGTCETWSMPELNGYPKLHWFDEPSLGLTGMGSSEIPYGISNASDLGRIMYAPTAHYCLEQSVDLSGIQWSRPVVPFFAGSLDGNDFEIQNLSLTGDINLGLFGILGIESAVSNLGVTEVNMVGVTGSAGALAAINLGTVSQCHSTGEVRGINEAGGLLGVNEGTIQQCFSRSTVYGTHLVGGLVGNNRNIIKTSYSTGDILGQGNDVGGLVGMNQSVLTQCFATGSVTGINSVGGLVGTQSAGEVSQCYSTGHVIGTQATGGLIGSGTGLVESSFWEVDTSVQVSSAGGTAKTSAQMTEVETFMNAGWDFTGHPSQGIAPVWYVSDVHLRPALTATGQFTVYVQSSPGGHVSVPGEGAYQYQYLYDYGTTIPLSAKADAKYLFQKWLTEGSVLVDNAEKPDTMVHVLGDCSVYAVFVEQARAQIPDPSLKAAIESTLGTHDVTITEMKALTALEVADANVIDLTGLQHAVNLTYLDLTGNDIIDINAVAELTSLVVLGLGENRLSDCSALTGLIHLEQLALNDNQISDIQALQSLTNLQALNLNNNRIQRLAPLAQCRVLQVVWLNDNAISMISPVIGLEHITWLAVADNPLDQVTRLEWTLLKQTVETKNKGRIIHDPISFMP